MINCNLNSSDYLVIRCRGLFSDILPNYVLEKYINIYDPNCFRLSRKFHEIIDHFQYFVKNQIL